SSTSTRARRRSASASASTGRSGRRAASPSRPSRSRWRASSMSGATRPTSAPRSCARPPTRSAPSTSRARPTRRAGAARTCSPTPTRRAAPRRTRSTARRTRSAPGSKPCAPPASTTCCSPLRAAASSSAASRATSCRSSRGARRWPTRPSDGSSAMADVHHARDAKAVEAAVQWALAQKKSLEIVGHGSKRALGRPAQVDATLDLSGLTGVTLYEPEELVLSARAGTPLAEIEGLLDGKAQQLAFEPMDYGPLLGLPPRQATIGGVVAANLAGPRRIKAGAARDHFLGFTAVSGRGETFKSGGRVVKNVTGYDLCKLMAGSWGTLAALTEVTIKTLPHCECEKSVLVAGLDPVTAVAAMTAAMGSACDVSGAAHLPAEVAAGLPAVAGRGAVTALRLEGFGPSVAHRERALTALLSSFGEVAALDQAASQALWRGVR